MTADKPEPLAFILDAEPAPFWWPVMVPVPTDGDYLHARLDVQFELLPQTELDKMRGLGLADGEAPATDLQICQRVVRDVRVKNKAGQVAPFTPQVLQQLLAAPMVRTAMVATYLAVTSGLGARKNG
jgi:hypothetical protein